MENRFKGNGTGSRRPASSPSFLIFHFSVSVSIFLYYFVFLNRRQLLSLVQRNINLRKDFQAACFLITRRNNGGCTGWMLLCM